MLTDYLDSPDDNPIGALFARDKLPAEITVVVPGIDETIAFLCVVKPRWLLPFVELLDEAGIDVYIDRTHDITAP